MEGDIMKRILSVIAALFLASSWALAENVTLTFQEGDASAYSNTNDAQGNEEYPNYNLESSAYLSAGGPSGYQRVCFVQFPDIIGSNQGQIPPTSTIVSATLTITSTDATNTSISAYRVTEVTVYQPAGGGNGYNLSPSYGYRDGVTTAWSVFGCNGTPSREATPQDTKLVSQGYSGISFNVTSAVQYWANNPTQNWGLAFRGQNVIQGFYSSDEGNFTSYRPCLQVTFTPPAPETETLTFQKGNGGSYSDVEDSYMQSDYPAYTYSASAYLQAGANTSTRTCSVIRFPNIIGTNYGQIPDDAQIVSAKLVLTSTDARNIPVSVYKVTEPWHETGTVFGAGGQANDESPSWNERMKRVPWTTLGCGAGSREATALSTVTVSAGYSAIEWSVTAAVQAWANNRDQNFGLCIDAPDATVIQGFYSSNEGGFPQFRPKLEVEYVVVTDTTPPDLVISTGTGSDVSPAFVEGTCGADAVDVKIAVNGGASVNVVRRTVTTWYTYVTLSSTAVTHIAVTATDAADNTATASQDLTWNVTDIPNASDLTILKDDSLILTATGAGTALEIDPGTGTWQNVGAPGDKTVITFDTAGSFVVRSRIDGGTIYSINVAVVSIDYGTAVACQVGYTRDLEVVVTPTTASAAVTLAAINPDYLRLQHDHYTGTGLLEKLTPLDRGAPIFEARLGGISGRIICSQEVDEFTMDIPARGYIGVDAETGVGFTDMTFHPYVSGLDIEFEMFSATSTFAGGAKEFTAHTSTDFQQEYDEATGEMLGTFEYEVDIPQGEDSYCFTLTVFQGGFRVSF
jgi:hypothetical protein